MTPLPENIPHLPDEKVRELIQDRQVQAEANRVPYPGAARAAFAPPALVAAGKWQVRPFYDGDFDVLEALNHPFHKMAFDKDAGGEAAWGGELNTVRGQEAWNLCYLMTTPVEEIQQLWETSNKPVEDFENKAKAAFRWTPLGHLVDLQAVILKQFGASFSGVIGYDAAATGEQKKM